MKMTVVYSALAMGLCAGSATYATELPEELAGLNISIQNGENVWNSEDHPESITSVRQAAPSRGKGSYWIVEGGWATEGGWTANWQWIIDPDPFVSSSFNINNPAAFDQQYSVSVTLPTGVFGPTTTMEGSVSGSILDADGVGGATAKTPTGLAFYSAEIDAASVHTEYPDFSSVTAPPAQTNNLPTINWGPLPGPGITASIGITNDFILTGGDTFQMVSTFLANAIPAPGAMALLGMAGLSVARRRR